jgi:signal transduction histidine kinase
MSIKSRLVLLLGGLLAAFATGLWQLERLEEEELHRLLDGEHRKSGTILHRWIEATGNSLEHFTTDYSQWTELFDFAKKTPADPVWAKINIDASLEDFDATAAWVLRLDGTTHYAGPADRQPALAFPLTPDAVQALVRANQYPHFFAVTPVGVVELRGAPVQPSEDTERETPPVAWFFTARLWDDAHLAKLGKILDCTAIGLLPPDAEHPAHHEAMGDMDPHEAGMASMLHWLPLPGLDGKPLRVLRVECPLPNFLPKLEGDAFEFRLFLGFGLTVIAVLVLTLHRWVLRPLGHITESLERHDPAALAPLLRSGTEFAAVGRAVGGAFAQRAELEAEIAARRRAQVALQANEAALRRALDERVRLGRDLHDGVIQSLYAAGLGLAVVRDELAQNPVEATRRIAQVRDALNETILDLRVFIAGLEPEEGRQRPFAEAVEAVISLLRAAVPLRAEVAVDDTLAGSLSATERAAALLIVREALANSLRHGRAQSVRIALQPGPGGGARLELADDGTGFDLAALRDTARGLANMQARAHSVRATFALDTAPGRGTRVTVQFPPTSLT